MAAMIAGQATAEGTARYVARFADRVPDEHFRELRGIRLSSLGLGTYLGREDDATDALYRGAVGRALERGFNVLDTAVNYRHQRSERAVGAALAAAIGRGAIARDEVVVTTKGGYLPFDGDVPADARAYFRETYVRPGIVQAGEIVGSHCMAPRFLRDQLDRSLANLGLATVDVYYLHNPESQLDEVSPEDFRTRIRAAFTALEEAAGEGKLGFYGTATWNGYRVDPGTPGALSLPELVTIAREVGGQDHRFRVIQLPYNLGMPEAFTRASQKVENGFFSTLDVARHLGVYVMASASILQGRLARGLPGEFADLVPGLTTDAQRALQFVRSTPGIGTALVGMKSVAHVEENAAVAALAPLAGEQVRRLFTEA
jgi:aryl-alcohol dehydrogenase-like predicted oxidoreductase